MDVNDMHKELQDAASHAVQRVFDEYCRPGCKFEGVLSFDQLNLVLALCREITEEMIMRYDELPRP